MKDRTKINATDYSRIRAEFLFDGNNRACRKEITNDEFRKELMEFQDQFQVVFDKDFPSMKEQVEDKKVVVQR